MVVSGFGLYQCPNQAHKCHPHTMGDATCTWFVCNSSGVQVAHATTFTSLQFLIVHHRQVNIVRSLVAELQSRRPLPLHCALHHHRQVTIAPSIAVHPRCARGPLRSCLTFPSRWEAIAPSIAIAPCLPSRRAVHHCRVASSCRHLPSICVLLPNCRCTVRCRQVHQRWIAVKPSIVVYRTLPLSTPCTIFHCCPCRWALFCNQIAVAPSTVHCRPASIPVALSIPAALSIATKPSMAVASSITVYSLAGCRIASRLANVSCPPVQESRHGMFNFCLIRGTILWHVGKLPIVLRRIWTTNEEIWIGHVVGNVLSGPLMAVRWIRAWFWQPGWCGMTMITYNKMTIRSSSTSIYKILGHQI